MLWRRCPSDATSAKGATVAVAADGSYTYDATGSATLQALAVGETTTDTFTYTITDSNGGTDTATVTHHENEQFTYILEGALRFWIGAEDGEEIVVRAGEVLHIPSNVPHKAVAIEDTLDLDVFVPPRADWLDGTDVYLRG